MTEIHKNLSAILNEQIGVENTATPLEAIEFVSQQKEKYPTLYPFFKKLEEQILLASTPLAHYQKKIISKNVHLYSSSEQSKRLLVCFCGTANRLMIPIPVFLQYLPRDLYDVLVLKDHTGLCFHSGIQELGKSTYELIRFIEHITSSYPIISTFGTSGGGYAALCFGVYLNAEIAISVGGRHPSTFVEIKSRLDELGMNGDEFDFLIRNMKFKKIKRILAVYSEKNYIDRRSAEIFSLLFPQLGQLRVAETDEHNCLHVLQKSNLLRHFFDKVLCPGSLNFTTHRLLNE